MKEMVKLKLDRLYLETALRLSTFRRMRLIEIYRKIKRGVDQGKHGNEPTLFLAQAKKTGKARSGLAQNSVRWNYTTIIKP